MLTIPIQHGCFGYVHLIIKYKKGLIKVPLSMEILSEKIQKVKRINGPTLETCTSWKTWPEVGSTVYALSKTSFTLKVNFVISSKNKVYG